LVRAFRRADFPGRSDLRAKDPIIRPSSIRNPAP
jgi:hypothetical protein